MTNQGEANSREKTLGENVVIISLIALLMGTFIYYFFKQEKQLTKVGFDSLAHNFSSKITAVRAQWFMDNQPLVIVVKEQGEIKKDIQVNSKGWVDYSNTNQNCENIWQAVMGTNLVFMNSPIAIVEIKDKKDRQKNLCRYSLPTGEYFDYLYSVGKVSLVISH